MNNGAFGESFPYSNFHDLNMDWIIQIAKNFLDQYTHIQEIIADGEQSLTTLTTNGEQSLTTLTQQGLEELETKKTTLEALLQAWYDTHSADIANELASALQDLNTWYATHVNYLDETLATNITLFNQRAENKATEVIASIPADYSDLSDQVAHLRFAGLNADELPIDGLYVNCNTGVVGQSGYNFAKATDFIEVYPGDLYSLAHATDTDHTIESIVGLAFYDSTQTYISGISYENREEDNIEFAVPGNAMYIRFTIFNDGFDKCSITLNSMGIRGIENRLINKVVGATLETGYINCTTGTGNFHPTQYTFSKGTSNYIPVIPYSILEMNNVADTDHTIEDIVGMAFYNGNKEFISGISYANQTWKMTIIVPADATYFRFTVYNDDIDKYDVYYTTTNSIKRLSDLLDDNYIDSTGELIVKNNPRMMSCFLKIGVIGDSLASGESADRINGVVHFHDLYNYSWGNFIKRKTNCDVEIFARGGLKVTNWETDSMGGVKAFDGNHTCLMYYIGLGQNDADYIRNNSLDPVTYIGSASDINLSDYTQNADTFYGHYGRIIQRIRTLQPKADIFIMTNPLNYVNDLGINTAIREIATLFSHVFVIDLFKYCYQLVNHAGWTLDQNMRAGHYNAIGYEYIARMIMSYTDWIMHEKRQYFRQIEFIGTDWNWT